MNNAVGNKLGKIWQSRFAEAASLGGAVPKKYVQDFISALFCPGPFYYYIFNFNKMDFDYLHPSIKEVLGLPAEGTTYKDIAGLIHPDDVEFVTACELFAGDFLFNKIEESRRFDYKVSYTVRFKSASGTYINILHQAIFIPTNKPGQTTHVFGVHTNVSGFVDTSNHKISFIGLNGAPSHLGMEVPRNMMMEESPSPRLFSEREMDVIRLIAQGNTSKIVADLLNISFHTVRTHRRNILNKSKCNSSAELISFCLSNNYI